MTAVGDHIKALRSKAELSHDELAIMADVDVKRLAGMEDGWAFPTRYECEALEAVLPGCKPGDLEALARPSET